MEFLPDEMISELVSYLPNDFKKLSEIHPNLWYNTKIVDSSRLCLNKCIENGDNVTIVECDLKQITREYKSFKFYIHYTEENIFSAILKRFEQHCTNKRINHISISCVINQYTLIEFDTVRCDSRSENLLAIDTHFLVYPKCKFELIKILHYFFNNNVNTLIMNQIRSAYVYILDILKNSLVNLQIIPTPNNFRREIICTNTDNVLINVLQSMPKLKFVNFEYVNFLGQHSKLVKYSDNFIKPMIEKFEYTMPSFMDLYSLVTGLIGQKLRVNSKVTAFIEV